MKNKFRIFCALLAWATILGQYAVLLQEGSFGGFGATTLSYFGFFTVTTNILVALAFSVPLMRQGSRLKSFFERPAVRAAITLYIFVVAVIYYGVLAADHNPEGISAVMNVGLHFVLPVLYILDWLLFADKGTIPYRSAPYWTLYPISYGLFNLLRGHMTGFYPYPFLDISKIGMGGISLNMLGFTLFYGLGGVAVIYLGRVLSRRQVETVS